MRQFGLLGRILFGLFGAFLALPTTALLIFGLATDPSFRGFDAWFGLASLLAGTFVCFRVAFTGNPGTFLSRRVSPTGVDSSDSRNAG